jgi:peptide/nickel transport system substrate-binding protein
MSPLLRKLTRALGALCAPLALAGCVQGDKTPADTLIIGVESEIKNMDVRFATDANAVHVSRLVTQSLIKLNNKLLAEGDLAQSFQISDGGKKYTFKIPAGLNFHDGSPLSSRDVLYSFEQAAGPHSKIAANFANVAHFSAPDPTTFVIELKKAQASFLLGEVPAICIVPARLGEDPDYGQHPVGSGPYKFVERRHRDLIFERFNGYRSYVDGHPMPLPYFRKVIVRAIEDPTTRFLSLLGGDIDLLFNALSPRRIQEAAQNPHLKILRGPGITYQYLGLNFDSPKFRDLRVRRALALAIDRESIIEHKLRGFARIATSVLSPVNYFYDKALEPLPYDPDQARRLLNEAGVKGLSFELKSSTDRDTLSILQVIQKQWADVGVKVTIRPYEFATFFADVQKGSFEAFSLRWTSVTEPDLLYKIFHSSETPPGRNRTHYKNAQVDRLLEAARIESDVEKRKALYARVQEILAHDIAYISLWYPDNVAVATRALKNFDLHPAGSWMNFLKARKDETP